MSYGVAKKISHAYLVDPQWLLYGKAAEGVQCLVATVPWTKELVTRIRLRTGAQMDEATRKELLKQGSAICDAFARLLERAINDGKWMQVMTDAELAFEQIVVTYYDEPASEEILRTYHDTFHTALTAAPHPKEKESSRKRRERT